MSAEKELETVPKVPADDGSVPPAVQLPSDVLYDDSYVRLTETQVIIKKYYFPFANPKTINYADIERCATGAQLGLTAMDYKTWGMSLSPIWWACGPILRGDKVNLVITVRNKWPSCGFTVENLDAVMQVLREKGVNGCVSTSL